LIDIVLLGGSKGKKKKKAVPNLGLTKISCLRYFFFFLLILAMYSYNLGKKKKAEGLMLLLAA